MARDCAGGHVSLEDIDKPAYIMRVHLNGNGYGADFEVACVIFLEGESAYIKALSSGTKFTPTIRRHIRDALRELGCTKAHWQRRTGGEVRDQTVKEKVPV